MTKCPTCGFVSAAGARICANCGYEFTLALEPQPDHERLFQSEIDPIKEKLIEKYQILRFLGKGGFSTVFLLKDKALERLCALKILAREQTVNPESVERFKREARLYASLDHPHIVAVYDFGIHNHVAYIIFKYIDGITLHEHIRRRHPMTQAEIVAIASDLADILGYMHQRGIVHRDLKPDNVMIQSGDRKVILTDFGLAKKLDTTTVTSDGKVMGSPHYFSPEQAKGEPVDARSDIYSLGITIFEMVSGIVPFKGDTPYEVILKHIREPLPDTARLRPDLPAELHRLIRRCTEKEPQRRFQDALELKAALLRIPPAPARLMDTEVIRHGLRQRKRRKLRAASVVAGAAVVAAALVGIYLFINRGAPRPAAAKKSDAASVKTLPQPLTALADERFASLLREAQEALSRGDFAVAREKAAAARALKTGREVDELDGLIRTRYEAEMRTPVYLAGQKKEKPLPAASPGAAEGKSPDSLPAAPPPVKKSGPGTKKAEPILSAPQAQESGGSKDEAGGKPEPAPLQSEPAEKPAAGGTARIMDLPDALRQSYIRELGMISTPPLAGEFQVSGAIATVLAVEESGHVVLKSLNDSGVRVDPESRRPEILELVKSRINAIRVERPVGREGNAVRIESWRVTFRVARDRQALVLVRIN